MAFEHETRMAHHLFDAVENGSLSALDTRPLLEEADPALVYFLFAWLRARYGPGHPASDGVLGRIVELCAFPTVMAALRKGERDSIVKWFAETHEYSEFDRYEFVDVIIEKLEG